MDKEFFLLIEWRSFTTKGFNGANNHVEARVVIVNDLTGGTLTIWHENSCRGFSRYGHNHVLPAAQQWAGKVAAFLDAEVVVEEKKEPFNGV